MTSIYLIRHGQASFGKQDYDQLSELGQSQARRLGTALKSRVPKFDAVFLGSMKRHYQTAEQCLNEQGAVGNELGEESVTYDKGWNEYDHQNILAQLRPEFSTAEGLNTFVRSQANPKQAFSDIFNDAMNRWISGEHDGYAESWQNYCQRVKAALKTVIETSKNHQQVAVFTSGGPISLVSNHLLGTPLERIMQLNWTFVNCGITKIVATDSRVFISSLNEHGHFEGPDNKHFITYK